MKRTEWPRSTRAWPSAHAAWLLPMPGRPKASTLMAASRNSPVGELVELRARGGGRRPRRRSRTSCPAGASSSPQARDAALVAVLGLELEHVEQQRQGPLLPACTNRGTNSARGGRELEEPVSKVRDLIADGGGARERAHAAAPARAHRRRVRSGAGMWITGTVERSGAATALARRRSRTAAAIEQPPRALLDARLHRAARPGAGCGRTRRRRARRASSARAS